MLCYPILDVHNFQVNVYILCSENMHKWNMLLTCSVVRTPSESQIKSEWYLLYCFFKNYFSNSILIYFGSNVIFLSKHIFILIGLSMVFSATCTCNNISVISWWSVLLVEETGVPVENHRPVASHWQTLSHNVVWSTLCLRVIQTHYISGDRHWFHW